MTAVDGWVRTFQPTWDPRSWWTETEQDRHRGDLDRALAEHARVRKITLPDDGIVDDVAVRRFAEGNRVLLTRAELRAVAALMRRRGHTITATARQCRVSGTTIVRWTDG